MPSKGQNEFAAVFPDFPHGVHRHQIVEAAPQRRGVFGSVTVGNPTFQFGKRTAKDGSMFNGEAPKQQHGRRCIGCRRVSRF